MSRSGFAYMQARLHARYGDRSSEAEWGQIEASRDLGHCLEGISRTSYAKWVARLDKSSNVHAIEQTLRGEWFALVADIAGWGPLRWRACISWLGFLPHLRLLEFHFGGEEPPSWLRQDLVFGQIFMDAGGEAAPYAPLLRAKSGKEPLARLWLAEWYRRVPEARFRENLGLALDQLFSRYLAYDQAGQAGQNASGGRQLTIDLSRLFRSRAQTPVAAFAYLGLAALDFERLRGLLSSRAIFTEPLRQKEA